MTYVRRFLIFDFERIVYNLRRGAKVSGNIVVIYLLTGTILGITVFFFNIRMFQAALFCGKGGQKKLETLLHH